MPIAPTVPRPRSLLGPALATLLLLGACGGGDPPAAPGDVASEAVGQGAAPGGARALATGPSDSQRAAAVAATAQSTVNACSAIKPFYWEMGNRDLRKASGSVQAPGNALKITATLPVAIASASKWVYASYVAQRAGGVLSPLDRELLSLRGGYVSFTACPGAASVDACLAAGHNGDYTAAADGRFVYGDGHMQKHASMTGLGAMGSAALAAEMQSRLGSDIAIRFAVPQLASGMAMSGDAYGRLLRKMLRGELRMGALLGSEPVCTNPLTCGVAGALVTPVPTTESWHYSAGHWIEDDPVAGDGAFSSAGATGFYPWIDASRQGYGVIARVQAPGSTTGFASVQCGRLLRRAWASGTAQ